jgi:HK97 family phage portal protein
VSLFRLGERRVSLENPAVPLTDPGLLAEFGGDDVMAGVTVTERSALSLSAVFRSVALLSGTIAGLPIKTYRYRDRSEVVTRPLSPYNDGPYTVFELIELLEAHLLLWGNAYLLKVRTAAGSIDHLIPIHPSRVKVTLVGAGAGNVGKLAHKLFEVSNPDGSVTPLTTREILHIPGLGYDGVTGYSVLTLARQTFGLGLATEESAARFFGQGTMLSGVLTTDRVLDQAKADALKKRWREKVAGIRRAHEVVVLDAGSKFQALAIPPADAQMLEARVFQVEDIARWFGLPPYMIGEVSKNASQGGGNGIEAQGITMVRYVLNGWLCRIEARFTREVAEPQTQFCEFVREGLLRGEIAVRYAAYATAIASRFMVPNEARALENMPPIPGGDELAPVGPAPIPNVVKPPSYPSPDGKG